MLRASGIFLLVFFCSINGISQDTSTLPDPHEMDSGLVSKFNELSRSLLNKEPEKAMSFSKKALEAAKRLNYKPGVAEALSNLGQVYLEQGEPNIARKYLLSYQAISAEMQDSLLLSDAYFQLGMLYLEINMLDKANDFFQKAIPIAKPKENEALLAKCYNQMGRLYFLKQEYEQAQHCFFQSIKYTSPEFNQGQYAAALYNIGIVYKARGEYRKSLKYLKQALSILEDHQEVKELSAVMLNIGEIYRIYNDYDLAKTYYHRALNAALQVQALEGVVKSYQALADLHAEKEQYKLAYEFKSLYAAYQDTLTIQQQQKSLQKISDKLETERREEAFNQLVKEKELEFLNQEYKFSKLQISQKNELIYFASLFSLLLSGLVLLFYQRNKLKKRKNQQLEAQNLLAYHHNQELQEVNNKLKKSEQELKELNKTKDKFFSIISHDLRSPLYTLSGFIQVMKEDMAAFTPEELNRFSVRMENSLQGVTALLDNLFKWASTQTGLIEFAPIEFRFRKVVEENILLLQGMAEYKQIQLLNQVPQDFKILADIQMMRLLLRNLLANALKFTASGGCIKLNAQHLNDEVMIEVQDNGIGMSEEGRHKLLNEKGTYTRRGTENEKGSGLGLQLCKEFVEMHRGRIEIETTIGRGTSFKIFLPQNS